MQVNSRVESHTEEARLAKEELERRQRNKKKKDAKKNSKNKKKQQATSQGSLQQQQQEGKNDEVGEDLLFCSCLVKIGWGGPVSTFPFSSQSS